jgi:hypothetical protein
MTTVLWSTYQTSTVLWSTFLYFGLLIKTRRPASPRRSEKVPDFSRLRTNWYRIKSIFSKIRKCSKNCGKFIYSRNRVGLGAWWLVLWALVEKIEKSDGRILRFSRFERSYLGYLRTDFDRVWCVVISAPRSNSHVVEFDVSDNTGNYIFPAARVMNFRAHIPENGCV